MNLKRIAYISFFLFFVLFFVYSLNAEEKTIKGKVICIGCELKHIYNASSNCKIYGHKHGIKTSVGKIYSFVENEKTNELINSVKYHGKNIEVTGKILENANFIDVKEFKVLEEKTGNPESCSR